MNCKEFNSIIDTFLDKELSDQEVAEFEQHYKSCKKCHDELENVEKTTQILRYVLRDVEPPISIKDVVFKAIEDDK